MLDVSKCLECDGVGHHVSDCPKASEPTRPISKEDLIESLRATIAASKAMRKAKRKCPGCGKQLTKRSKPECAECCDLIADLRAAKVPVMTVQARGKFALVPARPEQIIGSAAYRAALDMEED